MIDRTVRRSWSFASLGCKDGWKNDGSALKVRITRRFVHCKFLVKKGISYLVLAKQRRWSHVSLFSYFLSKTRICRYGASFKLTQDSTLLDWVGLGWVLELLGIARWLNLCFGCWSAWNCYKLTTLFAGLESQTRKVEDSHYSNLSSCNLTILWTFRFLVFSTSMASDLFEACGGDSRVCSVARMLN